MSCLGCFGARSSSAAVVRLDGEGDGRGTVGRSWNDGGGVGSGGRERAGEGDVVRWRLQGRVGSSLPREELTAVMDSADCGRETGGHGGEEAGGVGGSERLANEGVGERGESWRSSGRVMREGEAGAPACSTKTSRYSCTTMAKASVSPKTAERLVSPLTALTGTAQAHYGSRTRRPTLCQPARG